MVYLHSQVISLNVRVIIDLIHTDPLGYINIIALIGEIKYCYWL